MTDLPVLERERESPSLYPSLSMFNHLEPLGEVSPSISIDCNDIKPLGAVDRFSFTKSYLGTKFSDKKIFHRM